MNLTAQIKVAIGLGTVLLISLLLFPGAVLATTVSGSSNAVTFNNVPVDVTSVKIAAPGGMITTSAELTIYAEESFADGDYQYELIGKLPETNTPSEAEEDQANGRGRVTLKPPVGVIESGDFRIINGAVVDARTLQEN